MTEGMYPILRIPVSTYRLQFNRHFRFTDAKKIVQYLHDLGITDIYSSPYLKAKEGSLHGYDIVDHHALNPDVGTEEEYDGLVSALRKHDMGQILDIVPNHMEIASKENLWWIDVLENGLSSVYEKFFDIDWHPVKKELTNKLLLPILGDQYGNILENQELILTFEEGAFYINYYEHMFPIRPQTYSYILRHRLKELETRLTSENPHVMELLSIITALDHLPPYTELNEEKVKERYREKEVIKKRLLNLYAESTEIKEFIDQNINIFHGSKGDSKSFDLLDNLLDSQVYRLSYWRVATEEINYRRFFDISNLAAIRVENPEVFKETHSLVFRLIRENKVTGLRVDHPDGLYNPSEYFQRLQGNCLAQSQPENKTEDSEKPAALSVQDVTGQNTLIQHNKELPAPGIQSKQFYIVGEKILALTEKIPEDWPIYSTTGYEFLNLLNGIFVETRNAKKFDRIYTSFIKTKLQFHDIVYEKKKLIMRVTMSSEINTLGYYLKRISEKNRQTRDYTLNSLINAIIETIALFPIYRTYINSPKINDRDRRYIELTIAKAKRKNPAINETIFSFLKDVLLNNCPEYISDTDRQEWLDFVMRFQQITGPVMAKGVEDTSFYIYNRLVSLNEVGGSPDRFGTPLETFHGQNTERIKSWPYSMIATSTHDTKRSEDVRARINVLSEMPERWKACLAKWGRLNKKNRIITEDRTVPDRNEEYLFYQTLIGVWPIKPTEPAENENELLKKRIKEYMLKAIREAKVNTSWINPNSVYEDTLFRFVDAVLKDTPNNLFLKDFKAFQSEISQYGLYNSLSQTLLKITSPGIPDFYQGTELYDFSLVDPDNRRQVHYENRMNLLQKLKKQDASTSGCKLGRELTLKKEDGLIKLYLIYKALNYRKENREIFENGDYVPLDVTGAKGYNVCAFARVEKNAHFLTIVPRFITQLIPQPGDLPFGKEVWADTFVIIPFGRTDSKYRNIFTGEIIPATNHKDTNGLFLSEIFINFPAALLEVCSD